MMQYKNIEKHRISGLDLIKIICALLIYMRHSITMFGCTYNWSNLPIDWFVQSMTGPVMSTFFIVSGFSVCFAYYGKDEFNAEKLVDFYKARLVRIMPAYLLMHFLWPIFGLGAGTITTWLVLTPLEFSGLQSMYANSFGILHNGGTWFVSCILISYFVFPAIKAILSLIKSRFLIIGLTVGTALFLVYLLIVATHYQMGSNYANPFYRTIEFFFGACLASCLCGIKWERTNNRLLITVIITLLIIAFFLLALRYDRYLFAGSVQLSNIALYPAITSLLVLSFQLRIPKLETSKVISYVSSLTYYFFILQMILWNLTDKVMKLLCLDETSNFTKIALSFVLCVLISILIKELIEKPIQKYLNVKKRSGNNT